MSRIRNRRGSEESLASADDSIDETRSVMSFILSRLPEHASIPGITVAAGLSSGETPSPRAAEGSNGDGNTLSLPAPYPVEVRKLQIPWAAVAAHLPRLLKVLLLLAAHALLVVAFLDTGWDRKAPWCQGSGFLLLLLLALDLWLWCEICLRLVPRKKMAAINESAKKQTLWLSERKWIVRTAWVLVWAAVFLFVAIDSRLHRPRVKACFGMLLLIGFGYVFSKNRSKIRWRPVLSGFFLQFGLGLLLLRWKKGDGLPPQKPVLALSVLSAVVFFGMLVSLLCHYGLLQCLALKAGRIMAVVLGTTPCESYCAAINIFLGMADSVLLIKPCLTQLTMSEIHCVMTCGFATISGSLFAVFTTFGVKAEDMIAASLMSAPAALGFAKLFYPETEESRASLEKISDPRKSRPGCTLLESVAYGLSAQLRVAAHVVASLLGFVSLVALLDSLLASIGSLVGWQFVTLNWLLGRLFVPLALAMGVGLHECSRVASLLGLKAALNEVVAYSKMAELARDGLLSLRSQMLCAHALCGFSNLGALGVQLGAYAVLAPERLSDCARVAGRAVIAGSLACFMTACTAGALTDTASYDVPRAFNSYDFL
ncbi:hypothetical protein MRX96_010862 [Rhipicephalus microplus]